MMNRAAPQEPDRAETPADHNRDVARGLKEYCQFPHSQGFAVMVNGQWGSGKTHFIKELMGELLPPGRDPKKDKPLYVSLYGVKDPSEIGDQLFQQLHPVLNSKATRLVGAVVRAAARATVRVDVIAGMQATGILPDLDISSMLSGAEGRIIIFDDFERAVMSPIALLGYINPLVEHDGCKAVILSDETKLVELEGYRERKEKTVGRTFEFRAEADGAYTAFMQSIDDEGARGFLLASQETVLRVFAESGLNNLRLLKQFLWDFERVWKTLTSTQRKHTEAMRELLSLLCASAMELRAGRLSPEIFQRDDILHHMHLHNDEPDQAAIAAQQVFKRYPTVRFDSTMLDRNTIINLLLKSKLPLVSIQKQLQQHPYFAKPEQMPSWRALWLSSEVAVDQHDSLVARFEADFDRRTFRSEAEIYHVIGLSLWLSDMGLPGWEEAKVLSKVEQYMADTYDGSASPDEMRNSSSHFSSGGAFGLGYLSMRDARFEQLTNIHLRHRTAWQKRGYTAVAALLHRLMTEDSDAFLRDVCFSPGGDPRFARVGVLLHIPAADFAKTITTAQFSDQREVLVSLSRRYDQVTSEPELAEELPWLRSVQSHLAVLSATIPPIARSNLSFLIHSYLNKTLTTAEARLRAVHPPAADIVEEDEPVAN